MCLVCACFAFGLGFARRLRAELRPELKTDSMGPRRVQYKVIQSAFR